MNARPKITLLVLIVIGVVCYAIWWAHDRRAAARRVARLQRLVAQEHALMQSNEATIAALQARATTTTTAMPARVITSPAGEAP